MWQKWDKIDVSEAAVSIFETFETPGAVQTDISHRRPVFDIKATSSSPLSSEPHRRKQKPWTQSKESNSECTCKQS